MRAAPCPTCRRSTPWEGNSFRPFCSERCKLLDLAAWADERFRIAGDPLPQDADDTGDDDR